ncbi:DUF551 domain-containing protein [Escherichia coli]|uniref:DUF551 domain-containing protein n=1 Tax=Escherichia coli TaxID=562 RepID=UPI000BE9BF46|nr:DUF551 domain-containing protein [Escherichia coli]
MTTITKERLQWLANISGRDDIDDIDGGEIRELARIALASLEEEPVAWLHSDNGLGIPAITRSKNIADSWLSKGWYVQPLYIAKPVPVVPDARPTLNNGIVGFDEGWNACRATMLHGVKPVSQTYKLNKLSGNSPVTPDGWISCSEQMPENIPGSCKEYLVFDGLNNKVHHDYWVVPDGDSAPVASFWNHYGAHVTHWMPLPEPPQEVN